MKKHPLIKGLALGAALGAAAALFMHAKDGKKKTRELQRAAMDVRDRVVEHAKRVGEVTKAGYESIVGTTLEEYREAKHLSKAELAELRDELMANWSRLKKML